MKNKLCTSTHHCLLVLSWVNNKLRSKHIHTTLFTGIVLDEQQITKQAHRHYTSHSVLYEQYTKRVEGPPPNERPRPSPTSRMAFSVACSGGTQQHGHSGPAKRCRELHQRRLTETSPALGQRQKTTTRCPIALRRGCLADLPRLSDPDELGPTGHLNLAAPCP